MDSGFFVKEILDYLEHKSLNYIIAVKNYYPIQRELAFCQKWLNVTNGIEITEFYYQATNWDFPRKMVAVRQKIEERPNATGKQLSLFEEDEIIEQYRFNVFVTNVDLPAKIVWDTYRLRADSENRIKELKEDFALSSFSTQNFYTLEATLNFVMMAYNLMSLFRQAVLNTTNQQQLKTLRYKIFATASYITKEGNKRILNLTVSMKNRKWWDGLFLKTENLIFPYYIANGFF